MIDLPQGPPSAEVRIVARKLTECGLRTGGFTVAYEAELQGVAVVIGKEAGAAVEQVACIRQATGHALVTIDDDTVQAAYDRHVFEEVQPAMLAEARKALREAGILDGFPERSAFASTALFGEAIERQCGMARASVFEPRGSGLVVRPMPWPSSEAEQRRTSCIFAAISYVLAKGEDVEIGFVGNAPDPDR